MSKETRPIIPAKTAIKAFMDAGYKSTASALSEVIDNSIEAESKNIEIIAFEEMKTVKQRSIKTISQIVVYDDGHGMDKDTLAMSLMFGMGTRLNSRKGMGRYGIGLPQASISQCDRTEVYSWRKGKCYHTYTDFDEICKEDRQVILPRVEASIPKEIAKEIKHLNKTSGTIIIWKECKRLDVVRGETLFKRMEKELCRIYRHYLDDNDKYGRRVNLTYKIAGSSKAKIFIPNDPLYLMTPSSTPGYEKTPIMIKMSSDEDAREGKIEIPIFDPITKKPIVAEVLFTFSFIKPEIHRKEMDKLSHFMNHLKKNMGISFVRHAREVDFGDFGYYDSQDPRQRWWGCEIRFEPVLDEIFGITNNKQNVRNMFALTKDVKKDLEYTDEEIENNPKLKLRNEITKRFQKFHRDIWPILRAGGKGTRLKTKRSRTVANRILAASRTQTISNIAGGALTDKEKTDQWKEYIKKLPDAEDLTTEELRKRIEESKKLKVEMAFGEWESNQFFTIETIASTAVVKINRQHPFFEQMYEPLAELQDITNVEQIDLMLMAWTRVQDELEVSDINREDFIKIRDRWGQHLMDFLRELKKIH